MVYLGPILHSVKKLTLNKPSVYKMLQEGSVSGGQGVGGSNPLIPIFFPLETMTYLYTFFFTHKVEKTVGFLWGSGLARRV